MPFDCRHQYAYGHDACVGELRAELVEEAEHALQTLLMVVNRLFELMLLAVNINMVAVSAQLGDLTGQVFALIILTVAAAEAAIGLAILVVFFRNRGSIAVEDVNVMKG